MNMFPMAVRAIILSMALGSVATSQMAHAAERFTLAFPSRELTGSLDEAAILRIKAPFAEGDIELSKPAESAFLAELLRLQKGLPRSGPILVAIEHRSGDVEAAGLSYRRLKWLRSAIIAKQSAISTDRVVIAAFARDATPAETEVLILPVELDLAGDAAEDGGVRAVALDSAFMGPVFVRLADTAAAAVASPAPVTVPPPPVEPAASSDGQAPAPVTAMAPADPSNEGDDTPAPATAAMAYKSIWCPAPVRPLDDFYPGGPIVPCGATRP